MSARALSALPSAAWLKNTDYAIDLVPLPFRVRAEVAGQAVLDSSGVLVMIERDHAPVYYVPRVDLRQEFMTSNAHSTYCPFKGDASYWDLTVGERGIENAFWAYLDPYPQMASLVDLVGVYWDRMDAWFHDDTLVSQPHDPAG